jgi:hypothetical protein
VSPKGSGPLANSGGTEGQTFRAVVTLERSNLAFPKRFRPARRCALSWSAVSAKSRLVTAQKRGNIPIEVVVFDVIGKQVATLVAADVRIQGLGRHRWRAWIFLRPLSCGEWAGRLTTRERVHVVQPRKAASLEACTGVLSARMDDGGRRARPPALSGAASVCGAKMGRQLS